MNLEIHTTVVLAFFISLFLVVVLLVLGIRQLRSASNIQYYRKRQEGVASGWRLIIASIVLIGISLLIRSYAEPVIYTFFEPSPSPIIPPTSTNTPTITLSPTITQTPTITLTPLYTNTPTITNTPFMPIAVEAKFSSSTTPDPQAVFSPIIFARNLDANYQPISPQASFTNPIRHLYGAFSYDRMSEQAQWTALWFRDGELVYFETKPWDGGTGGYGFTDWEPDPSEWLPGKYEVQIFAGVNWKVSGQFTITGDAPTPIPSPTFTFTSTVSPTSTPTRTLQPTKTTQPTKTPANTATKSP